MPARGGRAALPHWNPDRRPLSRVARIQRGAYSLAVAEHGVARMHR